MALRFHWMLPKGGELGMRTAWETSRVLTTENASPAALPDMDAWIDFAGCAEAISIDSVLISFSRYEPDTLLVACALGRAVRKLKFIAAYRLGLMQPTTFVQQLNTLSALIDGRIALNVVAGSSPAEQRGYGDFLDHDQRYARAGEFLAISNAFWHNRGNVDVDFAGEYYRIEKGRICTPFLAPKRCAPEIYIAGHSPQAQRLARARGNCWMRLIDTPETLRAPVARAREHGIEVCLRLCLVCRSTREEAMRAAAALLPQDGGITRRERHILRSSDSQTLQGALAIADQVDWLNPQLWTGLVPHYGSSAITLVGSFDEVASALLDYKRIGVTQFVISGWPKLEEMMIFGRDVLPLIRRAEQARQ